MRLLFLCGRCADPACGEGRTPVPIAEYEAARRAFGTDEDLLLIEPVRGNAHPLQRQRQRQRETERGREAERDTEREMARGAQGSAAGA